MLQIVLIPGKKKEKKKKDSQLLLAELSRLSASK